VCSFEGADNGKGIRRKDIKNVFTPGSLQKRGWARLSLVKRIVEEYHKGRIYVKNSEIGKGTTFRIELRNRWLYGESLAASFSPISGILINIC